MRNICGYILSSYQFSNHVSSYLPRRFSFSHLLSKNFQSLSKIHGENLSIESKQEILEFILDDPKILIFPLTKLNFSDRFQIWSNQSIAHVIAIGASIQSIIFASSSYTSYFLTEFLVSISFSLLIFHDIWTLLYAVNHDTITVMIEITITMYCRR